MAAPLVLSGKDGDAIVQDGRLATVAQGLVLCDIGTHSRSLHLSIKAIHVTRGRSARL